MNHLLLIDVDNLVHRYFHAPSQRPPADGIGFALGRYRKAFQPTHALMIFDGDGPTWRHDAWPGYKGDRPEKPAGLLDLFGETRIVCDGWQIAHVDAPASVEADDLIATYTHAATSDGWQVSIVSGDKDLTQLVQDSPRVRMHDEIRRMVWSPAEVLAKFGVGPDMIPDLLALIGDKSDNFPGVPKIGPRTAVPLLLEYGGFRRLMDRRNLITNKTTYERIRKHVDQAELCYRLATLRRDVPLPTPLCDLGWRPAESSKRSGG